MKYFLISLIFFISPLKVYASDRCTTWGCISTISELSINADGLIYVGTPLDEKLANCTAISGVYFTINPLSQNSKEMYSSVLAAYMSNKKIQLRVKEGHAQCELAYVRLSAGF